MDLYPHQKKIVDKVIDNFKTQNRQLIVVPTGGGKTVIFSFIIKMLKGKTLVIAHTREILDQCQRTLDRLNINGVDVVSVQKCFRNISELEKYDLFIIDECHRSLAPSYEKIINKLSGAKILGVTATPWRTDGKRLSSLFGSSACSLSILDMINDGLLCDFEGYRIQTGISLKGVSTIRGDFMPPRLAAVINVKNRNELILKEYLKLAPNEKTLCFAANVKHSNELAKTFEEAGIPSRSVHGELSAASRKKIIDDFKKGTLKVLVNCQILTEGFDEPSIECLLIARPTCSKTLYTQMVGRGCRLHPGKKRCKVIEFTDNEYDVASIEDLVSPHAKRFRIKNGELLKDYSDRVKKDLLEIGEYTVSFSLKLIKNSLYERLASSWQKKFLQDHSITFSEPLTEVLANQLMTQVVNGKY